MARLLTLALLLLAAPVWAEGPEFTVRTDGLPPCKILWFTGEQFHVSVRTAPTGPAIVTTVPGTNMTFQTPCPTAPGQYYVTTTSQTGTSVSPPSYPFALMIVDPNAPPAPVFGLGVKITTLPTLLNVRAQPASTAAVLAVVGKGTAGTIVEGPVITAGVTWWKVAYTSMFSGWCVQSLLGLVS